MKSKKILLFLIALTATAALSAKIVSRSRENHCNREKAVKHCPCYYGNHLNKGKPIMLNRRTLSIPTNHLLCGISGTGKSSLMKHEIQSVLFHTNDRAFVITSSNEYNGIADGYEGVIKVGRENKPLHLPDNTRFIVFSLEKIRYEVKTLCLSQFVLSERYRKCLEAVWECVCSNVNPECVSWIFIDDIQDIVCDLHCMSVLYDIIRKARTHGCTVTLSAQCLHKMIETDIGKSLLMNTNFLTLFALGTADKEFILNNYKDIFSESDILFLKELCSENQCGTGLHIVNNRLIDDESSGDFVTIPFDIKL